MWAEHQCCGWETCEREERACGLFPVFYTASLFPISAGIRWENASSYEWRLLLEEPHIGSHLVTRISCLLRSELTTFLRCQGEACHFHIGQGEVCVALKIMMQNFLILTLQEVVI